MWWLSTGLLHRLKHERITVNAAELNSQILGSVAQGINAAANRFAERMEAIRERNGEQKQSKFFYDYALNLAKQVDELTDMLQRQDTVVRAQTAEIGKWKRFTESAEGTIVERDNYMSLLRKRFHEIEDALQQQTAHRFSLEKFKELALSEIEQGLSPNDSKCLNAEWRLKMLSETSKQFMETTSVKKGLPAGYPGFRLTFHIF